MGTVITRINQILRGWTNYFRHAVCKHTLNRLRHFVEWRLIRWLRKRHPWRWAQFRRRFTTPNGRWLPIAADGIVLFNPAAVTVTHLPANEPRLTELTVESPVRGDTHAGFGERLEETDRQQCRHRASGRLNHRIVVLARARWGLVIG
jgi:hypothetical protein